MLQAIKQLERTNSEAIDDLRIISYRSNNIDDRIVGKQSSSLSGATADSPEKKSAPSEDSSDSQRRLSSPP